MAGCLLSPVRCRLVEASALRDCRFRLVILLFHFEQCSGRQHHDTAIFHLSSDHWFTSAVLNHGCCKYASGSCLEDASYSQSVEKFEVSSARGLL
jgi:hypothetical protein